MADEGSTRVWCVVKTQRECHQWYCGLCGGVEEGAGESEGGQVADEGNIRRVW